MPLFFYVIIFLLGLVVGSFLNCVIYRLEKNLGFIRGRSYCPHCRHKLSWKDLIPILSFFILKRKCRYCKTPISWQYPLVEFTTGLLFIITTYNLQPSTFSLLNLCYLLIVNCFLIIVFVYDLRHYIIPDKIVYPAILIVFLYRVFEIWSFGHWNLFRNWKLEIGNLQPLLNPLISATLASAFFLLIVLASRGRWMGLGDVKLAFFMGLLLGFPDVLVALFLAFLLGAIIGMGLIISRRKTFKSEIPFGPFLVVGTLTALFWGEKIVNFYLNLMKI